MAPVKTIAFVSDAVYPYNKGGKETRLFEISTRLAAQGFDVHIYCMKWWDSPESYRTENGVHLHAICPFIPLYDGHRRSIKQGVLFGLACLKLLTAKFDVIDVDHMPFFPIYAVRLVCWLRGKQMQATWHEVWGHQYWQEYLGGMKGLIAWWIEKWSVWCPDIIIAVSDMTGRRLQQELQYTGELIVIPNGIDLDRIESAKKSKITSDVIYAGRLLENKNINVLLEAIAEAKESYPQLKVVIAGEGPEKPNLLSLATKLKLDNTVTFLPFQDDIQDLYGLMKASKVFVLPSSREGFGLVVLEANASGIPVITVAEPGNAATDLISQKNGRICQLRASDISASILSSLSANTKVKIDRKYSWNRAVEVMANIL